MHHFFPSKILVVQATVTRGSGGVDLDTHSSHIYSFTKTKKEDQCVIMFRSLLHLPSSTLKNRQVGAVVRRTVGKLAASKSYADQWCVVLTKKSCRLWSLTFPFFSFTTD